MDIGGCWEESIKSKIHHFDENDKPKSHETEEMQNETRLVQNGSPRNKKFPRIWTKELNTDTKRLIISHINYIFGAKILTAKRREIIYV